MRDILDRYYTKPDLARQLVSMLDLGYGITALEPSVGGAAFSTALYNLNHRVYACDIDHKAIGLYDNWLAGRFVCSFLDLDCNDVDWIIGNPPYNDAENHCKHAIKNARIGVAFLLRLGFMASVQRSEFWRQNPPTRVIVLSKRPSFTGDGKTDGSEYAFFVWEKNKLRMPVEWI